MIPRLLLISSFFSLIYLTAQAQNTENSLLPEINPQDIEIRSEFKARFPGLRRQPILGFNPKPRVYQIDPNRMPFIESNEEAVAGIEMTELDRPQPPQRIILYTPDQHNAYLLAGLGNYTTAEIEGYGVLQNNENSLLSTNLNFYSTNGHLDYQESEERFFDLQASYLNRLNENWQMNLDAGIFADKFFLFNDAGLTDTPEKDNSGLNAGFNLKKINNAFSGMEFKLGGSHFNSDLPSTAIDVCAPICYGGEMSETSWYSEYKVYWPGKKMYEVMRISASFEGARYNTIFDNNWMHAKTAFEYERLIDFRTKITGRGGIQYISDSFSDKIYLVPELELKHTLSPNLSVSANAYARPEMQTAQEHQQFNRFLDGGISLRHSYNLGLTGEVAYKLIEGNAVFGGISYEHVRDYSYYQREDFGTAFGFYNIFYGDANIFEIYAGITQQLVPEKFWFNARIYGRNPSLTDGGKIPYEERIGIEGSVSFKPLKKLTLNAWAEYIGEREDPAAEGDLDAFALINGKAEFKMNEKFGLYVKVLNILGQNYQIWNGYQERPFQVFGGITFKL